MVPLEDGCEIYVIKRIRDIALSGATKPTHLIRRLMPGIFNPENLMNVTLTGRAPHGQGEEKAKMEYECLDMGAKNSIIDFVKKESIRRGWTIPSEKDIKNNFTQVIGEMKRDWAKRHQEL